MHALLWSQAAHVADDELPIDSPGLSKFIASPRRIEEDGVHVSAPAPQIGHSTLPQLLRRGGAPWRFGCDRDQDDGTVSTSRCDTAVRVEGRCDGPGPPRSIPD